MINFEGPCAYDKIQTYVESNLHNLVKKSSSDILNIVIVGAWYGLEIQTLLNNYPSAFIYAFEAYPQHYNVLCERFKYNNRVECINKAVTDYVGISPFYELNLTGNGSVLKWINVESAALNKNVHQSDFLNIPCSTLKDELSDIHIDLLWIDVQGAELSVLKGADLSLCDAIFTEVRTHTLNESDLDYYENQTFKEDLDQHLNDLFVLHSIGLDEHNGQGNAFYIRKEFI